MSSKETIPTDILMEMGKVLGAQSYTNNYRLLKVLRTKENSLPEKSTPIGYLPTRSVLKPYVYRRIQTGQVAFVHLGIFVCLTSI